MQWLLRMGNNWKQTSSIKVRTATSNYYTVHATQSIPGTTFRIA